MLVFDCFALSEAGHDPEVNEDFMVLDPTAGVFAVADGIGGRPGGERASRVAAERLVELVTGSASDTRSEAGLRDIVAEVNRAVRQIAEEDPALTGVGTTLSAALVDGPQGKIVHVGDSRIFLFRDDELHQLTRDHTLESDFQLESPDTETRLNPRLAGMLTRTIGTEETVEPDVENIEVRSGDWLILATDGVTKALGVDEMREALLRNPGERAETICTRIFRMALDPPPGDDMTLGVVVIREGTE